MLCILDECNYLYGKVPTSKDNTICNVMSERGSASFSCDAIGPCNTFSVLWFKLTNNEDNIRRNSSEHNIISQSDRPSGKYRIQNSEPQTVANGHCSIGTILTIYRFNHSDNGYYWCQIVSNNSNCLLLPSPRGYIAVGETMTDLSCTFERQLPRPMCAENASSLMSEEMECDFTAKITPTVIDPYSTHTYNINSTIATSTKILHDTKNFGTEENMVWVYGLTTALLLVIIVLVLSLVVMSIKYRIQQKPSKHNAMYSKTIHCTYVYYLHRLLHY